jgi:hypothetical protein
MNCLKSARVPCFIFLFSGLLHAGAQSSPWKSGRVSSISINAQGPNDQAREKGTPSNDIWWNYGIASKDADYSVLSRESPARVGMKKDGNVRFQEGRNQIFVLDAAGKRVALKILRKEKRQR